MCSTIDGNSRSTSIVNTQTKDWLHTQQPPIPRWNTAVYKMTAQIEDKPVNEPETPVAALRYPFPYAIIGLSLATGAPPEPVALAACALLAGLAGPGGGLCDERNNCLIKPSLNVIMAGFEIPTWNAAQDLLLHPIEAGAKQLRDIVAAVDLQELERPAPNSAQPSPAAKAYALLKDRFFENSFEERSPNPDRALCLFRRPTCVIRGPTPGPFSVGTDEILDDHVMLLFADGDLFPRLIAPRPGKPWIDFGDELAGALNGESRVSSRHGSGGGRLQSIAATLYANCSHDHIKGALMSNRPAVAGLLRSSWLVNLDPEPVECGTPDFTNVMYGCSAYNEAVNRVFSQRRSGHGLTYTMHPRRQAQLHAGLRDLHQFFGGKLSPGIMPFFRNWRSLAPKILWGLITLQSPSDDPDACVPLAIYLTRWLMLRQLSLLEGITEEARRERQQRERTAMLRKLAAGPCTVRELMRLFAVQQLEVHAHVVDQLVLDGLVERTTDGLLMLTPKQPRLSSQ